MAVDLSYTKGSVIETANELGIDPGRINQWRSRMKAGIPLNKSPEN